MLEYLAFGLPSIIFIWSFGSLVFDKWRKFTFETTNQYWLYSDGKHKRRIVQIANSFRKRHYLLGKYGTVKSLKLSKDGKRLEALNVAVLPSLDDVRQMEAKFNQSENEKYDNAFNSQAKWSKDMQNPKSEIAKLYAEYRANPYQYALAQYDQRLVEPPLYQKQKFVLQIEDIGSILIPVTKLRWMKADFDYTGTIQGRLVRMNPNLRKEVKRKTMPRIFKLIMWASVTGVVVDIALHINPLTLFLVQTFTHHG